MISHKDAKADRQRDMSFQQMVMGQLGKYEKTLTLTSHHLQKLTRNRS